MTMTTSVIVGHGSDVRLEIMVDEEDHMMSGDGSLHGSSRDEKL